MLKSATLGFTLAAIAWAVSFSAYAMAVGPAQVDIPAGHLVPALEALERQAAIELVFQPEQLKSFRTQGVKGNYEPQDAVRLLLKDTTLELRTDPSGAMIIVPSHTAVSGAQTQSQSASDSGNADDSRSGLLLAQATSGEPPSTASVGPAQSSSAPSPSPGAELAEVVVTARKQAESLQKVPITVHALSENELENLAPKIIADLTTLAPGLNYQDIAGGRSGNRIQMRGITGGITGVSRASIFLDGIFLTGDMENIPFQFMQRVEVISGPQSAQFGRSTFAGAVNYVTKDPPRQLSGEADLTGGTLGEQEEYVSVGGPLTDSLRGIAYAWHQVYLGDWKSVQGEPIASTRSWALGGKLVFDPTDNLSIKVTSHFSEDADNPAYAQWLNPLQASPLIGTYPGYKPFLQGNGHTIYWLSGPVSMPPFDAADASQYINPNATSVLDDRRSLRSTVEVTYLLPNGSSLNLTEGYFLNRESPGQLGTILGSHTLMDTIGNPNYGLSYSTSYSNLKSTELRFTSPSDRPFHYMGGLFYQNLDTPSQGVSYGANVCLTICTSTVLGSFRVNTAVTPASTDAVARDTSIFGSVGYDFTDKITGSFEARYQSEYILNDNFVSNIRVDGTFNAFLPRLDLQYKATDHLQFYAVYSVGNNPGAFNTSQFLGLPGTGTTLSQRDVGEEKLFNYEVGMKSTWLENTLLVNVAVFHDVWDKMQVPEIFSAVPYGVNTFSVTENLGSARIDGVELDAEWVPVTGLNLSANFFWNKGIYTDYCSQNYGALLGRSDLPPPNQCIYVNGDHLENVPRDTANLSAAYTRHLSGDWNWFVHGNAQYTGIAWTEEWNSSWSVPYTVFNAFAGVSREHLKVELFCTNCGNETGITRIGRSFDLRDGPVLSPNDFAPGFNRNRPLQYGVHVNYTF